MSNPSPPVTTSELVLLDVDAGADKQAVIGRLAGALADAGRSTDREGLTSAALAREGQSATGLPGGIAIPHCRSPYVDTPTIGFARLNPPVDFGAPDGPADLVFLIAAPDSGGAEHLKLLSSLARALVRPDFIQSLRGASSAADVVALVDGVVNPSPGPGRRGTVPQPPRLQRLPLSRLHSRPQARRPRRNRSSPSRRARRASRTPTWRPRPSSGRRTSRGPSLTSRRRVPRAARR